MKCVFGRSFSLLTSLTTRQSVETSVKMPASTNVIYLKFKLKEAINCDLSNANKLTCNGK